MAPLPIKSFLKELKLLGRAGVDEVGSLLKNFKSNIKSLDDVITKLPVTKNKHGFIELGENSIGKVNKVMREGNLSEIVKMSGKNIPVSKIESASFKSLVADTPEKAFKDVTDLATANKKSFPHLDLKEADLGNMSKSAAKDVKKVESNLYKYFKTGTKIVLTVGVVYVGVDWLIKTNEKRKGCFMLTTINGKTTSCKVQTYSCVGSGGDMCTSALPYYNITLVLIKIASMPDTDALKIKVAAAAGVQPSALSSSLANVIDTKYSEITTVIADATNKPTFVICELSHPDVEKGEIPPCRMCSPSDTPISTSYIDPKQYPDNVTFQCSPNPSLLDTLADVVKNTGKDLFDGISGGLTTLLKPLLILGGVIIIILILISVVMNLFKNRGSHKNDNNKIQTIVPMTLS